MASTQVFITTVVFFLGLLSGSYGATLMVTNKCSYTVWPAILSAARSLPVHTPGLVLQPGDTNTIQVPPTWSGRLWGRTLCSYNITGSFTCVTGDCISSTVECGGATAPVTLAEFTLNGTGGLDYFDVSLVDGFNLPLVVEPRSAIGAENCRATGCRRNLNKKCPVELQVIKEGESVVGCKSSCEVHEPCSNNSNLFSHFLKTRCPDAYHNASFTCVSADFTITFCPAFSKRKFPAGVVERSSHYVLLLLMKILIPIVFSVSILSCCACNIWYRSPNRECRINMFFGRAKAKTHDPQQNTANSIVEMVDGH
ncbi:thaumatin-like protein 1 [Glycine soja]|nr:thaumatin-like protein 1 [Glycine soja]